MTSNIETKCVFPVRATTKGGPKKLDVLKVGFYSRPLLTADAIFSNLG